MYLDGDASHKEAVPVMSLCARSSSALKHAAQTRNEEKTQGFLRGRLELGDTWEGRTEMPHVSLLRYVVLNSPLFLLVGI